MGSVRASPNSASWYKTGMDTGAVTGRWLAKSAGRTPRPVRDRWTGWKVHRLLVTGSRDWSDEAMLRAALDELLAACKARRTVLLVRHGACPDGADAMADRWAAERIAAGDPVRVDPHPANWNLYGKQAGMARNTSMVNLSAEECWGFFEPGAANKGTRDCYGKADTAGIPIRRFPPDTQETLF